MGVNEAQKQYIESDARGCELALRMAHDAKRQGTPDQVHMWDEVARMYSERAFALARQAPGSATPNLD